MYRWKWEEVQVKAIAYRVRAVPITSVFDGPNALSSDTPRFLRALSIL
jgi:hypothetical protein